MLPIEIKSKIVTLRNYTNYTWEQIGNECGCSVSKKATSENLCNKSRSYTMQTFLVGEWPKPIRIDRYSKILLWMDEKRIKKILFLKIMTVYPTSIYHKKYWNIKTERKHAVQNMCLSSIFMNKFLRIVAFGLRLSFQFIHYAIHIIAGWHVQHFWYYFE